MSTEPAAPSSTRRPGRPPGTSTSRRLILEAARTRFSTDGYTGATIRKIAADAEVDASLVMQFFGSKEKLFAEVLSIEPGSISTMTEAFDGPVDAIGERVTRAFLQLWAGDSAASEPLLAMLRAAIGNEPGQAQLREFIQARLTQALGPRLRDQREAALRAGVAASMIIGVVIGRRMVQVRALVDEDLESLIALVAPAVQSVLEGGR